MKRHFSLVIVIASAAVGCTHKASSPAEPLPRAEANKDAPPPARKAPPPAKKASPPAKKVASARGSWICIEPWRSPLLGHRVRPRKPAQNAYRFVVGDGDSVEVTRQRGAVVTQIRPGKHLIRVLADGIPYESFTLRARPGENYRLELNGYGNWLLSKSGSGRCRWIPKQALGLRYSDAACEDTQGPCTCHGSLPPGAETTALGLRDRNVDALPCVIADFDGNGHQDVALAEAGHNCNGANLVRVLLADPHGGVAASHTIARFSCLTLYPATNSAGKHGEPATKTPGLVDPGEGATTRVYLYRGSAFVKSEHKSESS